MKNRKQKKKNLYNFEVSKAKKKKNLPLRSCKLKKMLKL